MRELLGALNRLVAFQAVSDKPLRPEQARRCSAGSEVRGRSRAGGAADRRRGRDAASSRHRPQPSEFGDFLSEIAATVAQQVDAWRAQGQRGHPALGGRGVPHRPARGAARSRRWRTIPSAALREFEADVARLQALQAEAAELAPELAGSAAFRDPANLDAAEEALRAGPRGGRAAAGALAALAAGRPGRDRRQPGGAARPRAPSPRSRPAGTTRWSSSARAAVGKTHLLHALGNALAERGGPGGLPQRATSSPAS